MIIEDFLRWIESAPVASRIDAADALARAYLYTEMRYDERVQMEAGIIALLDDPSSRVRRRVAEILAPSYDAPSSVIFGFLDDQADIADIILLRSPLLGDTELINAIATEEVRRQVAVAMRHEVSVAVSATLIEMGDLEACLTLIANPGALIADISLEHLCERFGGEPAMREALLKRVDLSPSLRQVLVAKLGDALCDLALVKNTLSRKRADHLMRDVCDQSILESCADLDDRELQAMLLDWLNAKRLTPSLMMRAACFGHLRLAGALLSVLSKMPLQKIMRYIEDGNSLALSASYRRSLMPQRMFCVLEHSVLMAKRYKYGVIAQDPADFARRLALMLDHKAQHEHYDVQVMAMVNRFAAFAAREAARHFVRQCREPDAA